MKKMLKKITALILTVITLASLFSCGSKDQRHNVGGLDFTLPEYMGKLVSDGYGAYSNKADGTKVLVYYYSTEAVSAELPDGVSLKAFAEHYVAKNKIEATYSKYDEKSDTYTLKYFETVEEEELYSHDYFIKGERIYYHFRMTCKKDLKGDYEKTFNKWQKTVKISDSLVSYSECGLNFSIPDYMEKIEVPATYADICFRNRGDGAEFFIYYYSRESLLADLSLNMDVTVKEYVDWHEAANDYVYVGIEEEYDEENKIIVQKYHYEPENTFYYNVVMRDEYSLIHVTMSCDIKDRGIYEPIFESWAKDFSFAY